jgi:hypothetical protein
MSRTRSGAANTTPRRCRVTPRQYRAAFAARVRQARTVAHYPVDEMALLLGVTRDTYTKYEGRGASLMRGTGRGARKPQMVTSVVSLERKFFSERNVGRPPGDD